jgi:hypothetical protein
VVLFAASQFSNVRVREAPEGGRRVRVRHSSVPAISAVVRIPPVQLAAVSRRVPEWAERQDYHPRECPPNQPGVQAHLRVVPDSATSTGPKKGR